MKKAIVLKDEQVIISDAKVADTFFSRLFGLMPTKSLDQNSGLILEKCKQIHTFNMKYVIDAIFLSVDNTIIHIEHELSPNKMTKYFIKSSSVLEVAGGVALNHDLRLGDKLTFIETDNVK